MVNRLHSRGTYDWCNIFLTEFNCEKGNFSYIEEYLTKKYLIKVNYVKIFK